MTFKNMELWRSVERTNPNHTTKVNQRGGFTAIAAHSQVMTATEVFGPIGIGWGYTTEPPIFEAGAIIIPVTLWHGDKSNSFGPVFGCADFSSKRLDTDAPKKATTDGLTKALSMLGFNADVFLGKFDDNKYVAEVTKSFEPAKEIYTSERLSKKIPDMKASLESGKFKFPQAIIDSLERKYQLSDEIKKTIREL